MRRAFRVQPQRQFPHAIEDAPADQLRGVLFGDVDVVSALRLGGGRENRRRQPIRFAQALRQGDAAELTRRDVVFPTGPGQVAARHALDRQRLGPLHEHRSPLQQFRRIRPVVRLVFVALSAGLLAGPAARDPLPGLDGVQAAGHERRQIRA